MKTKKIIFIILSGLALGLGIVSWITGEPVYLPNIFGWLCVVVFGIYDLDNKK